MRWRTCLGLVAAGFAAIACSRHIDISIAGPATAPVAMLGDGKPSKTDKICLSHFAVYEASTEDARKDVLMWRVQIEGPLRCTSVQTVTYGVTPEGFKSAADAKPLRAGVVYNIRGSGYGSIYASFVYSNGSWRRVTYSTAAVGMTART